MATGPAHYQRAEELLAEITGADGSVSAMDGTVATIVEAAQVHATLALAAATAMAGTEMDVADYAAWDKAAGTPDPTVVRRAARR